MTLRLGNGKGKVFVVDNGNKIGGWNRNVINFGRWWRVEGKRLVGGGSKFRNLKKSGAL